MKMRFHTGASAAIVTLQCEWPYAEKPEERR